MSMYYMGYCHGRDAPCATCTPEKHTQHDFAEAITGWVIIMFFIIALDLHPGYWMVDRSLCYLEYTGFGTDTLRYTGALVDQGIHYAHGGLVAIWHEVLIHLF